MRDAAMLATNLLEPELMKVLTNGSAFAGLEDGDLVLNELYASGCGGISSDSPEV
jgi:hypothetical protein